MVITKQEDVTKKGFCKIRRGKLRLRGLSWSGTGVDAYSRLGANLRLGAYLNKYGRQSFRN